MRSRPMMSRIFLTSHRSTRSLRISQPDYLAAGMRIQLCNWCGREVENARLEFHHGIILNSSPHSGQGANDWNLVPNHKRVKIKHDCQGYLLRSTGRQGLSENLKSFHGRIWSIQELLFSQWRSAPKFTLEVPTDGSQLWRRIESPFRWRRHPQEATMKLRLQSSGKVNAYSMKEGWFICDQKAKSARNRLTSRKEFYKHYTWKVNGWPIFSG